MQKYLEGRSSREELIQSIENYWEAVSYTHLSRVLYTPPVTPWESVTPEVSDPTCLLYTSQEKHLTK